jgi:hypothetical protein
VWPLSSTLQNGNAPAISRKLQSQQVSLTGQFPRAICLARGGGIDILAGCARWGGEGERGQELAAAGFWRGELERENRELRRATEILKAASIFFARELDPRQPRL